MSGHVEKYLQPTSIIDSDNDLVKQYARRLVNPRTASSDPVKAAITLYYSVRDKIMYNPYSPFSEPEHYRASNVIKRRMGFCVSKASLLCALGRTCRIPSRLGFATVKNHLATKELIELLGSNIFVYHGFTEFYLKNKWVKATPAFNITLCKRHHVAPLEFNGYEDSVFQAYNLHQELFMEYIEEHGSFADVPVKVIVETFKKTYGRKRVESWIEELNNAEAPTKRDFMMEQVIFH